MKYNHYLEIKLQYNQGLSSAQVAEVIMRQVHHINSRKADDERLALAFPDLNQQSKLGARFQVFGHAHVLEQLINLYEFSHLQARSECSVKSIQLIPESALLYKAFIRDRQQEKRTVGHIRRNEDRAIRRVLAGKNTSLSNPQQLLEIRQHKLAMLQPELKSDIYHLTSSSASTGKSFSVFFRTAEGGEPGEGTPNAYGLSIQNTPVWLPVI